MPEEIEIETAYPTFKFSENGEPAKWLFIYLDLPRTEGFELGFAFVTDGNGRLGTLEIPEASAILERGETYNLFYDYRPWSEEELANLTEDDCQEVTIGDEILLDPKSGDIEVVLQEPTGEPLANYLYRLHLPDGSVRDGATDDSGVLSESDLPDGIIRLEMFTSGYLVRESGEPIQYEVEELSIEAGNPTNISDLEEITEDEEPSDEELCQEEDFLNEAWGEIVSSLEEQENVNDLSDDVFVVEVDWLKKGVVRLCRGRSYAMHIFLNWSNPWTVDFKHWNFFQIISSDEESDDSLRFNKISYPQWQLSNQ